MSFSYTGAGSSPTGAVRFAIGDTNEATSRISDEDIAYLLSQTGGSVYAAARLAIEGIIASLSAMCDQSVGDVSKSYSQIRDGYQATLAILKSRTSYSGGLPLAGGISVTAERLADRDRDRIKPLFDADMFGRNGRRNRVTGLGPNGTVSQEEDLRDAD